MKTAEQHRVLQGLGLLVRCEEAVGEFYQACARAWPTDRDLWDGLSEEEAMHAVRLGLLQGWVRVEAGAARLERFFPFADLHAFLEEVDRGRDRVLAGELTKTMALALARDTERSLLEIQSRRAIAFADPNLDGYLRTISAETHDHGRRLEERLWAATQPQFDPASPERTRD